MRADFLSRFLQARRLLKVLDRIATAHEDSSRSLRRIADHIVGPDVLPESEGDLKIHTGVSYATDAEQSRMLELAERFRRASGRDPSEDELLDLVEGRTH